jgi:hypothetical protein
MALEVNIDLLWSSLVKTPRAGASGADITADGKSIHL